MVFYIKEPQSHRLITIDGMQIAVTWYNLNDMDVSSRIDLTYEQIKDALNSRLNAEGYQIVIEHNDDKVFYSRFVIWSNNEDALRLIWDGKENWFVLEVADVLPLSSATAWGDIIIVPFDHTKYDVNYADEVTRQLLDSLD